MCCKEPAIVEIDKPAGQWCQDCRVGAGCVRYESRPDSCQQFECLWLHSQKPTIDAKLRFPADMRPDKCKVVLNKKPDGQLFVHVPENRANAWKQGKIGEWLRRENQAQQVIIVCGDKVFAMP